MLFTIEKYVVNTGLKFIRRFCTQTVDFHLEKSDCDIYIKKSENQVVQNQATLNEIQNEVQNQAILNEVQNQVIQNEVQNQAIQNETIQNKAVKLLKIAILGAPNAGKSTLINQLVNRWVCPTSAKVHTTRRKCEAVYSEENTQLIFVDTPGVITEREQKKFKLDNDYMYGPNHSVKVADIIGIIQDVTNQFTRNKIHTNILDLIYKNYEFVSEKPLLLILNKVDRIKKKKYLLELVRSITTNENHPKFTNVFMISALTGDGVEDLRNYLINNARPNSWKYDENMHTDQLPSDLIVRTVKAKLLDNLPHQVPYELKVGLQNMEVLSDGTIKALLAIICSTKAVQRLILGSKGKRIKLIASSCEEDLRNAFRRPVYIALDVTVNN